MGRRLFKAANTTDSAIAGSTRRDGSATAPSVARLRVIECATVKAVTIPNTFQNAGENASTGSHRPFVRRSTAGSSNESRNRMWWMCTDVKRSDDTHHEEPG